ncbi:MAG: nucleoside deaminase [Dehalococcoidia bacterium]
MQHDDQTFLNAALAEAEAGQREGGIPIGSVLVRDGALIAGGHNRRVQNGDQTAHAEIECLRNGGRQAHLRDATLYSTLMPCYLCSGAAVQFGVRRVVAGESRNFAGGRCFMEEHGIEVVDLDDQRCVDLLAAFIHEQPALWNEDIAAE